MLHSNEQLLTQNPDRYTFPSIDVGITLLRKLSQVFVNLHCYLVILMNGNIKTL